MRTAMLSLAFFLVSACAGSNPLQPDVPFRAIGVGGKQSASSGVLVIRTAAEWEPFLHETSLRAPSGNPDDPLPAIDFSSEMVVALFLGQRPTTGYRISVDRVTREGSGLQIAAVERPPCIGATVITYPMEAFAVAKTSGPVSVTWEKIDPICQ